VYTIFPFKMCSILFHEIGYQFGIFAMKLHIVSWNWVSVWKICNEIAYCFMNIGYQFGRFAMKLHICFMTLGINSENLQQNWVLFRETGYQFRKLAAKLGIVSWNWVSIQKTCSKIGYCFMKLGIDSEDLQHYIRTMLGPFFFLTCVLFCSPTFDLVPSLSETGTL
jgi:hypothetical protein